MNPALNPATQPIPVAKRKSSPQSKRGGPQPPQSVAATGFQEEPKHFRVRVLAVKAAFDWKQEESKALYNLLRDLSWQAAYYRNSMIRRKWAEAMGYRVDPAKEDDNDITRQGRKTDKGQLSGDAYSAAEQEVKGAWKRDVKKILAGQPLPEWKPTTALSVCGREKKADSGVKLEIEHGQFIAYLRAKATVKVGDGWIRVPLARHTDRDEYQGDTLRGMVAWSIPIKRATVHVKRHGIILRFTYRVPIVLPEMGERVATLGPVEQDGRLHLRTETQTKDFTSKLATILKHKDDWDLIRRRVLAQIGRKKGHARTKRRVLANLSWDNWLHSYIHAWTREIADWCDSQGVGRLNIVAIDTGEWPAYRFVQQLTYKCEAYGMEVTDAADVSDKSSERAATSAIRKRQTKAARRRSALIELKHQLGRTAT